MKAFTKGQAVTYIVNFDENGLFVFRQAVVYSCGKKQMVLTDATTGEEIGRHFRPELGGKNGGTFPGMTDGQAIARCEELAAAYLVEQAAFLLRLSRTTEFGAAYAQHMAEKLGELGEARGMDYNKAPLYVCAQFR